MVTEEQLEQLSLSWFQDTGWEHANGVDISPDGDDPERDVSRVVVLKDRLAELATRAYPNWLQLGARCRHAGWRDCDMMIWTCRDAGFAGKTCHRNSLRFPCLRVLETDTATEVPNNA